MQANVQISLTINDKISRYASTCVEINILEPGSNSLGQLKCCRKTKTVERLNRTVNTRSVEPWLLEEKSAFAETSNRGKLNNTISCTWLLPLATRPCKRERDETLYMGPTIFDTEGSNVSCVCFFISDNVLRVHWS